MGEKQEKEWQAFGINVDEHSRHGEFGSNLGDYHVEKMKKEAAVEALKKGPEFQAIRKSIENAVDFRAKNPPEEPTDITDILEPWRKPDFCLD